MSEDRIEQHFDDSYINYYRDFKNMTVKVAFLHKPVGKYKLEPAERHDTIGMSLKQVLVQRQGLNINVRATSGSVFQLHVPCTDELWDNINENQIYRYSDDILYLKFDSSGTAYEYILNSDPMKPVEEYPEGYDPAILQVSDLMKKKDKEAKGGADNGYAWDPKIMLFKVSKDPITKENKVYVVRFNAPENIKDDVAEKLKARLDSGSELSSYDVLDNNAIIVGVKNDIVTVDVANLL